MLETAKIRQTKYNQTTLQPLTGKETYWTSMAYYSSAANNIKTIFKNKTHQNISLKPINLLKNKLQNKKHQYL